MKKTTFLMLVILLLFSVNIFAQETPKNMLAIGVNLAITGIPVFNLEYERSFNNYFSIGAEMGTTFYLQPLLEIRCKWYPFGKAFFWGIGGGAEFYLPDMKITNPDYFKSIFFQPTISSEIGWNIKINRLSLIPYISGKIFPYSFFGYTPIPFVGIKLGCNF